MRGSWDGRLSRLFELEGGVAPTVWQNNNLAIESPVGYVPRT